MFLGPFPSVMSKQPDSIAIPRELFEIIVEWHPIIRRIQWQGLGGVPWPVRERIARGEALIREVQALYKEEAE